MEVQENPIFPKHSIDVWNKRFPDHPLPDPIRIVTHQQQQQQQKQKGIDGKESEFRKEKMTIL
jgi:hypothetical protein